ncbi:uracil-DNA glycosylase family protein [Jeotgalibaca caeni]|uniref:uracil-DNA glycosylase family protein n=1 Tax=Jeotgalibaca caeni TaxID=3028623 RepID=UPI00237E859C|nr:uracil-DNA glycosylase family protein [Jeotgalibaca caeni]MDE1549614.1 uracil-DNA glycosylase family protein [Jeotgalibaca caeni]
MLSIYEEIKTEIMNDPANERFTEQGIEPLFSAPQNARIAIIGQAPGIHAQRTRKYWNDQSGVRLRQWMNVTEEQFYESDLFTVLPMDFYYPGKAKTGDLPPRKDFAEKWHPRILAALPKVELILLVGSYAQNHYLKKQKHRTLTETVRHYQDYLPTYFPLVHPSPLNGRWLKKNPWFEEEVLPELKQRVQAIAERGE